MTTDNTAPKSRKPQPKRVRTIGTNVGQAIKDAQEAKRKSAAAAMRKMAGK